MSCNPDSVASWTITIGLLAALPDHLVGKTLFQKKDGTVAREFRIVQFPDVISGLLARPDGRYVAIGAARRVHIVDVQTGTEKAQFEHADLKEGGSVRPVAFGRDGALIASNRRPYGTIEIWETETGRLSFRISKAVLDFAFLGDGKTAMSASPSYLDWWEIGPKPPKKGSKVAPTKRHKIQGSFMEIGTFSADLKLFAGANTKVIKIWDVSTGEEKKSLVGFKSDLIRICFSPDGKRLATTGFAEKFAVIWDVERGEEFKKLSATDIALGIAYSPDGKWIAIGTGTDDKSVRIWEAETGREVLRLHDPSAPSGSVTHLAFIPKTNLLAVASMKQLRFWELSLDRLEKNSPLVTVEAKPKKKE